MSRLPSRLAVVATLVLAVSCKKAAPEPSLLGADAGKTPAGMTFKPLKQPWGSIDMPTGAFSKASRNDSSLARTCETRRALSIAMPAWVAYISSSADWTSAGRRPPSGRSTERMPTRVPATEYIGANSASSGCHASGSSLTGVSGTQVARPESSGSV